MLPRRERIGLEQRVLGDNLLCTGSVMSLRRTPSQRSTSTAECVRRTATEGALPEGADDPDGQWPGHCDYNTPQTRPFHQASRNEVDECSTAIPAFCGPPAQGLHKATTEFSTLVSHALAVADAPEKYPIMELKRAAIVLENEQKSHALSKHCPESVMNRITAQLTNLARVMSNRGIVPLPT